MGAHFDEVRTAVDIVPRRRLLIVDSLQLTAPPRPAARVQERLALAARALKALAVEWNVAVLVIAQLPGHRTGRADPRPVLDDLGAFGTVKQNADVILMIYREEMYRPGQGVEGATELIVAKNRNGPTGSRLTGNLPSQLPWRRPELSAGWRLGTESLPSAAPVS
jgi:replicative DNA helicase